MKIDYALYPTLLDNFYWYKAAPFDKFDEKFVELINKINCVKPAQLPDQAEKGVIFENVINDTLDGLIISHNYGTIVDNIASDLKNCIKKQQYIEAILQTKGLNIKLYGFVDYTFQRCFKDLKTTEKYRSAKYINTNQHPGYLLIDKLNKGKINRFEYLITDFKEIYNETYYPNSTDFDRFIFNVFEFIDWINYNKPYITNTKIFGGN